jgi:hypothetical protein
MAISYNALGSNGRLGNQMFQYAGLRGIAAHHGYDFLVPPPENYGRSNYGLFDCFKMTNVGRKNQGYLQTSKNLASGCFEFNENFMKSVPDDVNLHDYFQTEKYFKHISDEIRQDFEFNDEILESCKEVISQFEKPIFMHVRRGDYINQPQYHPFTGIEYYQEARKLFPDDVQILIFSDDLEWCRSQELFHGDEYYISDFDTRYEQTADTNDGPEKSLVPYYDLCMMSLCKGGVIANSSMSWWGAWLMKNPELPIVAPKQWFGEAYNHYEMGDLRPESWTLI